MIGDNERKGKYDQRVQEAYCRYGWLVVHVTDNN